MSYGIARVNGSSQAGSFYGYQPRFFKVTNTADTVGSADTGGNGSPVVEGNFTKALRGIQERASIVIIGAQSTPAFLVGIDGATANAYLSANDDTDLAAALVGVIEDATGLSDVSVTEVTLAVNASGVIS